MLISSHILAEIQQRVDRLAIMAAGKVQAVGTVQALRETMALPLRFSVRLAPAALAAVRCGARKPCR
jgi:Cu-processing system ATP-binding protein